MFLLDYKNKKVYIKIYINIKYLIYVYRLLVLEKISITFLLLILMLFLLFKAFI